MEDGEGPVCRLVVGAFIRGFAGFRSPPQPQRPQYRAPDRAPDAVVRETTRRDQATLYRLSGCGGCCPPSRCWP